MVKDTCLKEECPIFKKLKLKKLEECPNYILNVFTVHGENDTINVHDCAPKRLHLMVQELTNRSVGVQQDFESLRNETNNVNEAMTSFIHEAYKRLEYKKGQKQIPEK